MLDRMIPQHISDLIRDYKDTNQYNDRISKNLTLLLMGKLQGIFWATKEELKFIENHFPECKTKTNRVKYKREIIKAIEEVLQ